jgi:hypothetical protein
VRVGVSRRLNCDADLGARNTSTMPRASHHRPSSNSAGPVRFVPGTFSRHDPGSAKRERHSRSRTGMWSGLVSVC